MENNKVRDIFETINNLNSDNEIISYWENRQNLIIKHFLDEKIDYELIKLTILKFVKIFNQKEKFSMVYYIYIKLYEPLSLKFEQNDILNDLKFELSQGLFSNHKVDLSEKLNEELDHINYKNISLKRINNDIQVKNITYKLFSFNSKVIFIIVSLFLAINIYLYLNQKENPDKLVYFLIRFVILFIILLPVFIGDYLFNKNRKK